MLARTLFSSLAIGLTLAALACSNNSKLDGIPNEALAAYEPTSVYSGVSEEQARAEAIRHASIPPALIARLGGDVVRDSGSFSLRPPTSDSPEELVWLVSFVKEVVDVQSGFHSCDVGNNCEPGVPHVHEVDYVLIAIDAETGQFRSRSDGAGGSLSDWIPADEWEARWESIVGVDYETGQPIANKGDR
jgi:hypothetical protein